ncbi:DUF523 domain-containing protein [Modicisalibacter coralii]|uniref:DUF523 domain-containing protein n=1 Tax=Modicisalibacter coralii TaxID=2304602 RepID=UPI00100C3168|nr:DUF523 domain-containing protein [Halomonas coralii]
MQRLLISACLLGEPVRFDGGHKRLARERLETWRREGRCLVVCPECLGGLPVPRPAAEIVGGDGRDVLTGDAQVVDDRGRRYDTAFVDGAHKALQQAQQAGVRLALLKANSPSCGSGTIHDGQFSGGKRAGDGVFASLCRQAGIEVFDETRFDALAERLAELEAGGG